MLKQVKRCAPFAMCSLSLVQIMLQSFSSLFNQKCNKFIAVYNYALNITLALKGFKNLLVPRHLNKEKYLKTCFLRRMKTKQKFSDMCRFVSQ